MNEKKPYAPVLRTQADVEDAWRHLIRPLGWPEPRLWFMLVGADDVPLPQISEVTEMPVEIPSDDAEQLATMLSGLVEHLPFDRVAILLCRPGRGRPTAVDQSNAAAIYTAFRNVRLQIEVVHLATDEDFWPLPYDAATPSRIAV